MAKKKNEFEMAMQEFKLKNNMEVVPETGPDMVLWLAVYSHFNEYAQYSLSKQVDEILRKLFKLVTK